VNLTKNFAFDTAHNNKFSKEIREMKMKHLYMLLSLVVVFSLALASCQPASTTEEPTMAPATEAPATAEATEAPAAAPQTSRRGGWLDEIDVSVVAGESAISQLQAGAIDLYSYGLASDVYPAIKEAGLGYSQSYGGSYSIMFNPAVFNDASVLNPFSNRKIREAMNWLIDRNYINQEIYAGGSLPKFFAITTQLVEYTALIDTARALESKYAYNFDKAIQVISDEMTGMGATLGADEKWEYNGKPVSLIFLIRPDGDGTRKPMGDYVANQLESIGFTVDRQYKTSSEAAPIWRGSIAEEGLWHMYTAGWLPTGLTRDERSQIQQMYLNTSVQGVDPFISNVSDPEFQKLGDDLAQGTFATQVERNQMMARALELSLEDSLQVWTIEQVQYSPYNNNVQLTYDLAAGVEGAYVGPYNLRFVGEEGGAMKVGTADLYTEPWNTVSGSNWVWDTNVMRSTTMGTGNILGTAGLMGDPYTGLTWPHRIESAELTVKSGLPVEKNLDWFTMNVVDQIDVPEDTWVDWDATEQRFITAGEKFPDGLTASVKSVVTYPADLYETVQWHDGSPISAGDFVMAIIEYFDRAKPESAIYDESFVPTFEAFLASFKGYRIVSTDPLVVEAYTDAYNADAELNILPLWPLSPTGLSGENSWQIFAISNLAEAAGELAYTSDKADLTEVEQTSWVGGPSLEILAKYLDQAQSESYIPYEPTLGEYVTAEEAALRYENFKNWYEEHGHFWVGTGPYYLDKVFTTEKSLVLKNNTNFVDLADRWAEFSEPKLASIQLDGPGQVKAGEEAVFDALVSFKDEPYAQADIEQVKYILYDATGAVVEVGEAGFVTDGQYQVTLGSNVTSNLPTGSVRLEVAVVPIPVAIPAFTSIDFVVIP
jgi:peptide/nickel transport system substrate-binding protein